MKRPKERRRKCPTCHGRGCFMHGVTFAVLTCITCAGKGWIKL